MSSIARDCQPGLLASARSRRERLKQAVAFGLLGAVSTAIVIPAGLVVCFVVSHGLSAINWEFLTAAPRNGMKAGGIWPAIVVPAIW